MQVKPIELHDHLAGSLAPLYLISGDEPLLVQEACDSVLAAARAQGYTERSVLYADTGFNWHDVAQDAASLSLFAERRVVDVRIPGTKFDRTASEVLRDYAEQPAADTLLLLRCERLAPRQRSNAWFKALDKAGVVVLVWPVGPRELPRWLAARLNEAGMKLDANALSYLADRVEGNLLAAVQEIEKLKLNDLPSPVDLEHLIAVLDDAARYNTFDLIDAVFAGDGERVARMVTGLREEGVALFALLGALTSQLRMLGSGSGRMPPQRQRLVQGFKRRLGSVRALDRVLAQCALVDQQGKGQLLGDAWLSFETLLLRLAGTRGLPSLETELPSLRRPRIVD